MAENHSERQMTVLLSAFGCDPESGSEARNGWNTAVALARRGLEVWVLTHPRGRQAVERAQATAPVPGLRVCFVEDHWLLQRVPQAGWMARYVLWQRQALKMAKELVAQQRFDVVHHVTWGSFQAGSPLWKLNLPFIFGPVGGGQVAPPAFKQYFGQHWRKERLRSFVAQHLVTWLPFTRATIKHADMVLTTNDETGALARRMGARMVVDVNDIVMPDDFFDFTPPDASGMQTDRISMDQGETKVVWLGRRLPRKALPLAFEAMAQVDPDLPIHLYVVDGQNDRPPIPPQLDDKVTHLGKLEWGQVRQVLQHGDVLLFTSLRDSTGAQLFEALGSAMPVVALNHQGAGTMIRETLGITVAVTTPEETAKGLARAIERLHHDPALRAQMGEMGVKEVRMSTASARAGTYERLYAAVAASR